MTAAPQEDLHPLHELQAQLVLTGQQHFFVFTLLHLHLHSQHLGLEHLGLEHLDWQTLVSQHMGLEDLGLQHLGLQHLGLQHLDSQQLDETQAVGAHVGWQQAGVCVQQLEWHLGLQHLGLEHLILTLHWQHLGAPQGVPQQLGWQPPQPPCDSIRSNNSKLNPWVQRPTLRTSAPTKIFHFIEPRLLIR